MEINNPKTDGEPEGRPVSIPLLVIVMLIGALIAAAVLSTMLGWIPDLRKPAALPAAPLLPAFDAGLWLPIGLAAVLMLLSGIFVLLLVLVCCLCGCGRGGLPLGPLAEALRQGARGLEVAADAARKAGDSLHATGAALRDRLGPGVQGASVPNASLPTRPFWDALCDARVAAGPKPQWMPDLWVLDGVRIGTGTPFSALGNDIGRAGTTVDEAGTQADQAEADLRSAASAMRAAANAIGGGT